MGVQKEIFLSRDPQSLRDKDIPVSLVCVYISNKEELFSFSKEKTLLTSYLGYARQN